MGKQPQGLHSTNQPWVGLRHRVLVARAVASGLLGAGVSWQRGGRSVGRSEPVQTKTPELVPSVLCPRASHRELLPSAAAVQGRLQLRSLHKGNGDSRVCGELGQCAGLYANSAQSLSEQRAFLTEESLRVMLEV